ncbi:E3 SUMO- ligase NSE2-like [Cryptosporidium sp. chipmunk genotype I]|uniref:E3 SUMO- ligase NSE2-like n=1 Tax=Cryptosporidium sp. chipmunk genotype I TaxID=1280935 RepID=UPI00351A26C5|nr:E3 SUMO- ligase NSE2-like [Cryptosporidium sp. chipmunk genotype I]
MDDILRNYLNNLNELSIKYDSLSEKYKLGENLNLDERKKLYELFVSFEEMKLWSKSVLYGENDQQYVKFRSQNEELEYFKEMLMARLELTSDTRQKNKEKDQVSVVSRKVLPKVCCLTREVFKDPVSHRYETSEKIENMCKNHIYEKEALLKYLGNSKKKICPIVGCNFLVVKKLLKRDREVLDQIQSGSIIKSEVQEGIQNLLD